MNATRAYRSRSRAAGAQHTRERIVTAVRDLLREGRFHESTVEQVAERAGVSRATVYQHFRSRIDLVDAICETFDAQPGADRAAPVPSCCPIPSRAGRG